MLKEKNAPGILSLQRETDIKIVLQMINSAQLLLHHQSTYLLI